MMIKALIFDFDGLMMDTEYPVYRAWQEIYLQHGAELPLAEWAVCIGTGSEAFDPVASLEKRTHKTLERKALVKSHLIRSSELIAVEKSLPGVENYLLAAKKMGLKISVASSSPRSWVIDHLNQLNLLHFIDLIRGEEDVARVKPDPALYLSALEDLKLRPEEALVFEDSPNGITAAKAAGIYCVAVPNRLTASLPIQNADLILPSMLSIPLSDLIENIRNHADPLIATSINV
jgi:HAD superfamily hydrolase (TIGR01509 family)